MVREMSSENIVMENCLCNFPMNYSCSVFICPYVHEQGAGTTAECQGTSHGEWSCCLMLTVLTAPVLLCVTFL